MSRNIASTRRTQADRRAHTRRALLEATVEVLLNHGYDGCSLSRVAKHAGLTTGSVQHHFTTKSQLMLAVVEDQIYGSDHQEDQLIIDEARKLTVAERCSLLANWHWRFYGDPRYPAVWTIYLGAGSDIEFLATIRDWQKRAIARNHRDLRLLFSDLKLTANQVQDLQYFINAHMRGLALLKVVHASPAIIKRQLKLLAAMIETQVTA
jgi:AcrR family transcriptional regulator